MEKVEALKLLRKGWVDSIQLSAEELQAIDQVCKPLEPAMYTLARIIGVRSELSPIKMFDADLIRKIVEREEAALIAKTVDWSSDWPDPPDMSAIADGERTVVSLVGISLFKVNDDFLDARGVRTHGSICAQYMDGTTCVFAWADSEKEAVDRLRVKLRELQLDQRIEWVKHVEIEL